MTKEITCQLAHDIDWALIKFPVWGFWKIDGARAAKPVHRGFVGRSMDAFKNTALNARFAGSVYDGFDGELTVNGWLSHVQIPPGFDPDDDNPTLCGLTSGLVKRTKLRKGETALPDNAVWNIFDWLHPDCVDLEYGERYHLLAEYCAAARPAHVFLLPYTLINSKEEALAFIEGCLDGTLPGLPGPVEGAIFRDPKAKHKSGRPGKKDNDFWRHKPVSDKDFLITGFEEAMENQNEAKTNTLGRTARSSSKEGKVGKGTLGNFLGTDVESGKAVVVPAGALSAKQRQHVWDNKELYRGQYGKYTSLDTGVKDAPRQARFVSFRDAADIVKEAA